MNIIEFFIKGKKGNDELCEDGFVTTNNYIAVIDGASSKTTYTIENKTTGRFLMETIKKCIPQIHPLLSKEEFLHVLDELIIKEYKDIGIYEELLHDKSKIPLSSLIVYSKHNHEIWMFGDCQAYINGNHYTNELSVDQLTSMARKYMIETYLIEGKTEEELMNFDLGREAILPFLKRQHLFLNTTLNTPFQWSAISGFGFEFKNSKTIYLDKDTKEIVLSSDGYPKLFDNLKETEEYLDYALKEDPLCYKLIISTKGLQKGQVSYDDRCYVRFKI